MRPKSPSFHAHHSPMGAMASFTCGAHGTTGGMGIELSGPYPGEITVGVVDANKVAHLLPLFSDSNHSEAERYVEGKEGGGGRVAIERNITRDYLWCTDRITGGATTLQIHSPFFSIPDPATATPAQLAFACCPCIHLDVIFNNTTASTLTGIFGLTIDHRWSSLGPRTGGNLIGATSRDTIGFASQTPGARCFIDFDAVSAINRRHQSPEFLLGPTAGLEIEVPAGETRTLSVVLGFFVNGVATYNREMHYYYTRHFTSLAHVLSYAMEHRQAYLTEADARNRELAASPLSDDRKFMIAHATRSYYGSTQWLWDGQASVWVVNEGEYLMMNTFDLTVDMLFHEMRMNPWTVRNVLEQFVYNYSFQDTVFHASDPNHALPGGISFTHDMGVMNHWSPAGQSAYEVAGLDRQCFSHMTCEQLTNWVLCAGVYFAQTADDAFIQRHRAIIHGCLQSLRNRDNPYPPARNGIMGFDSSRTQGGGEITTYDSLDHSLGQARNNIYLGGKMWASYLALEYMLTSLGDTALAEQCAAAALLAAQTISNGFRSDLGYIPAILEGNNESAIIPAIEALVYPYVMGLQSATASSGPYGFYIDTLKTHLSSILRNGLCLYPDGGWKLSSTADNSWASKIALCQFVASQILKFDFGDAERIADAAHVAWQQKGATRYACCDQFRSGEPIGSLYYPRIVTNVLWLHSDGTKGPQ